MFIYCYRLIRVVGRQLLGLLFFFPPHPQRITSGESQPKAMSYSSQYVLQLTAPPTEPTYRKSVDRHPSEPARSHYATGTTNATTEPRRGPEHMYAMSGTILSEEKLPLVLIGLMGRYVTSTGGGGRGVFIGEQKMSLV